MRIGLLFIFCFCTLLFCDLHGLNHDGAAFIIFEIPGAFWLDAVVTLVKVSDKK